MYTSTDTCISGHIELYIRWLEPHEDVAWWEQVVGTGRGKEERLKRRKKAIFRSFFRNFSTKGSTKLDFLAERKKKDEGRKKEWTRKGRRKKAQTEFCFSPPRQPMVHSNNFGTWGRAIVKSWLTGEM
jgi:hypothetical protein